MYKTERRICFYSALFITVILNSTKLLALRENGIVAQYWHFDLLELTFQFLYSFGFSYLLLILNLKPGLWEKQSNKQYFITGLKVFLLIIAAMVIGGFIQRAISAQTQMVRLFWSGYITRFMAGGLLVGIVIKILLLLRQGREKDKANLNY
jgi:two-component system LytT family sensor kinase